MVHKELPHKYNLRVWFHSREYFFLPVPSLSPKENGYVQLLLYSRILVTTNNAQEAYYILTPHMMEYILTMADKSGSEVYMSFLRDGKMQIAVRTNRDFFEL